MNPRKKPLRQKTPLKRSPMKQQTYAEALAKAKAKQAKYKNKEVKALVRIKKVKSRTNKPLTVAKLKPKVDAIFSKYIRLRDGQFKGGAWWCQCCTCERWIPLNEIQNGHFQSRRYMNTRYNEQNCNAQCVKCNIFNNGEQYKYGLFVDRKYGPGTSTKLQKLAQVEKRFKTWELEELIVKYQVLVSKYEEKR